MIYHSSYSKQLLISTILFMVILISALVYMIYQLSYIPKFSANFYIICCAFLIVCSTIIHSFCHQIRNVEFRDGVLILHKFCGAIDIPAKHAARSLALESCAFFSIYPYGNNATYSVVLNNWADLIDEAADFAVEEAFKNHNKADLFDSSHNKIHKKV